MHVQGVPNHSWSWSGGWAHKEAVHLTSAHTRALAADNWGCEAALASARHRAAAASAPHRPPQQHSYCLHTDGWVDIFNIHNSTTLPFVAWQGSRLIRVTGNGFLYWMFPVLSRSWMEIKMEESRTRLCRLRPGCWDCFEICSALFGHINFVHFQPPCPALGRRGRW